MQLSRILTAPLVVDVRRGAVAGLGALLADQRIATEGRVAVAVGPSQGDSVLADLAPENLGAAEVFRVEDSTVDAAVHLGKQLRADSYEAVAGIGGGKTIDVTKFAAHMAGIPMVAVATNLSHDGIASPVSSLEHESGKSSYGVVPPVAVLVDLDRVRSAPPRLVRAGIGDVVNNLSAIADWELAAADRGEPVDGLAVTMARTAAQAVLHQPGTIGDDEFLTVLAESLVLSGMAMTVAGSSRGQRRLPRDPVRHRPALPRHRQPRRAGRRGRAVLHLPARRGPAARAHLGLPGPARPAADPGRPGPEPGRVHQGRAARPGDPAGPVHHLGAARPGRARDRRTGRGLRRGRRERPVMPGPTLNEVRAKGQPPEVLARLNDEHWFGRLYMRKLSPYATVMFARLGWSPNAVTVCFMLAGVAAGVLAAVPGLAAAIGVALLIQLYLLFDCSDGELARYTGRFSATGVYLDRMGHYIAEALLLAGLGVRAQGHFSLSGGYVSAGLAAAICATLIKAETDTVIVARASSGLDGKHDDEALAPRSQGLALARRLASALRVHRIIQAVELSVLILLAAIADAAAGDLTATRVLTVAALVVGVLMTVAHLLAIVASRRLR